MYETLTPVRSPDRDRLEYRVPALPASGASVTVTDRLSLRLGLWLLLRSTRRVHSPTRRDAHTLALANERAREARESAAVRAHLLLRVRS